VDLDRPLRVAALEREHVWDSGEGPVGAGRERGRLPAELHQGPDEGERAVGIFSLDPDRERGIV
jgi:hypothetical protein